MKYPNINSIVLVPKITLVITYKRTWKERLFSLPWNPFKKYRHEPQEILLKGKGDIFYAHPSIIEKIKKACEENKSVKIKIEE